MLLCSPASFESDGVVRHLPVGVCACDKEHAVVIVGVQRVVHHALQILFGAYHSPVDFEYDKAFFDAGLVELAPAFNAFNLYARGKAEAAARHVVDLLESRAELSEVSSLDDIGVAGAVLQFHGDGLALVAAFESHVDFVARQPRFGDKAELGIIEDGKLSPVAVTDIWNWQQGCMLQWFSQDEIIYNDFENDHYVARILNLVNGRSRTLHRPIDCLSPDRRYALSLDFARLDRERPGYGYTGIWHPLLEDGWPAEDGLYLIDIEKDTSKTAAATGVRPLLR